MGYAQQVLVGFGVLWFGTVMFALFGKFCHPPDCDESEYFGSLWLSVLSSFTILTTANYPDVMLPAYGTTGSLACPSSSSPPLVRPTIPLSSFCDVSPVPVGSACVGTPESVSKTQSLSLSLSLSLCLCQL